MEVTITDILRIPYLSLTLVAGQAGTSNKIRWVHVSELEDPTPWLKGGELLLTTGMGLRKGGAQRSYVERLVGAGLAGLGFGTGFSYANVPSGLSEAAEALSFPLFEVPYEVPFIAITEAVFTRVAAGHYQRLEASVRAQRELTQAVLEGGGVAGIISALAAAVRGWAVAFDLHGFPLAAAPDSAKARIPELAEQVREAASEGPRFSLSLVKEDTHAAIQTVAVRGRVEGCLGVGKRDPLTDFDHVVMGHALHLLAIELDKSRAVAEVQRRLRGDFLDGMSGGGLSPNELQRGLRRFGINPGTEIAVIALAAPAPSLEVSEALEDTLVRRRKGFLISPTEDAVMALLEADSPAAFEELRREVSHRLGVEVSAGLSRPASPAEAGRSVREALYGLQVCRFEARTMVTFESLGTYRLLFALQDHGALGSFADSVLGPLEAYDATHGGQLLATLGCFLDHLGKWEAAASELKVHRHTLRYRIGKAEELTGRSVHSAGDRTELWLALRARELLRLIPD